MTFEARLAELGVELPPPTTAPPGVRIPFEWVRVVGRRCLLSGHGAIGPDGAPAGPFGRVPDVVGLAEAQESARLTGLAMIAALRRELGDLDRIEAWLSISGYVNAAEGYPQTTAVINPVSELVLEIFGDVGRHARTAIGVSALPLNLPVVVAAEVMLRS